MGCFVRRVEGREEARPGPGYRNLGVTLRPLPPRLCALRALPARGAARPLCVQEMLAAADRDTPRVLAGGWGAHGRLGASVLSGVWVVGSALPVLGSTWTRQDPHGSASFSAQSRLCRRGQHNGLSVQAAPRPFWKPVPDPVTAAIRSGMGRGAVCLVSVGEP